jgi:hypothetical protein
VGICIYIKKWRRKEEEGGGGTLPPFPVSVFLGVRGCVGVLVVVPVGRCFGGEGGRCSVCVCVCVCVGGFIHRSILVLLLLLLLLVFFVVVCVCVCVCRWVFSQDFEPCPRGRKTAMLPSRAAAHCCVCVSVGV